MATMKKPAIKNITGNISADSVLFGFSKLANEINRMPDRQLLKDNAKYQAKVGTKYEAKPITRNVIENHFGSLERLSEKAMEAYPELFEHVVEDKIFIPRKMKELKDQLKGKNGVIVSSFLGDNAKLLNGSLAAIKNFSKRNKFLTMLIPSDDESIPKSLLSDNDLHLVFEDIRLNRAICVSAEKINPKQETPLRGSAKQIRRNNSSMVFGSPKLTSKPIPCLISRIPDVAISTGSISHPIYLSKGVEGTQNKRRNVVAANDHNYAAIIIEFDGQDGFFWRNVQIEPATGEFIDLGIRYHANGKISLDLPEVQVYGDLHSYVKDVEAFKAATDLAKVLKVKRGVMHDVCDNFVMSHHKAQKHALKTAMIMMGDNNYGKEVDVLVKDLNYLNKVHSNGIDIVPSNHDDMDQRSLEDQSFLKDNNNVPFGSYLYNYQVAFNIVCLGGKPMDFMPKYMNISPEELKRRFPGIDKGITPLQAMVEMNGPEAPEKIRWHRRNDTWSVGRNELLQHGDRGSNGAKFSVASARDALGASVQGHSHTPGIMGDVMTVGHLAKKEQEYNMGGFSSWQHSVAEVYKNGSKQLITIIDGRYTNFNLPKMLAEASKYRPR